MPNAPATRAASSVGLDDLGSNAVFIYAMRNDPRVKRQQPNTGDKNRL